MQQSGFLSSPSNATTATQPGVQSQQVEEKLVPPVSTPTTAPQELTQEGVANNPTITPVATANQAPRAYRRFIRGKELAESAAAIGALCAVALYFLGYLTWAYHAWRNNLGFLPALQPQYIVAGIIPGIILFMTASGMQASRRIQDVLHSFLVRLQGRSAKVVRSGPFTLAGLGILLAMAFGMGPVLQWEKTAFQGNLLVLFLTLSLFILVVMLADALAHINSPTRRVTPFTWVVAASVPVAFLCSAAYLYVEGVYPRVPQEFGGVQPRIAYVDLKRAELSPETREALLPSPANGKLPADLTKDPTPVVRSVPVLVYWEGGEFLLVKPLRPGTSYETLLATPAYQVKKDANRGVTYLNALPPAIAGKPGKAVPTGSPKAAQ